MFPPLKGNIGTRISYPVTIGVALAASTGARGRHSAVQRPLPTLELLGYRLRDLAGFLERVDRWFATTDCHATTRASSYPGCLLGWDWYLSCHSPRQ